MAGTAHARCGMLPPCRSTISNTSDLDRRTRILEAQTGTAYDDVRDLPRWFWRVYCAITLASIVGASVGIFTSDVLASCGFVVMGAATVAGGGAFIYETLR